MKIYEKNWEITHGLVMRQWCPEHGHVRAIHQTNSFSLTGILNAFIIEICFSGGGNCCAITCSDRGKGVLAEVMAHVIDECRKIYDNHWGSTRFYLEYGDETSP